jgi:hypothetical protein
MRFDHWALSGDWTIEKQAAVLNKANQLIRQPPPIADRHFEIEFLDSGVEAFAFTFG